MLTGWARHMMELQFGEHISKINYINERCYKADILWKRMLTPAICAGIVAFIMFVCLYNNYDTGRIHKIKKT